MDWHAALIRTAIGPLWARWERSPYLRHYAQLLRTQYDDPETIRSRQWAALQAMLQHAYASVPFYRERFDRCRIHPDQIQNWGDYHRLPLLTKADIRAHGETMISTRYAPEALSVKKTSGSTGVSLVVRLDEAARQWKRACTLRSDEWSGWRFCERIAMLSGRWA